MYKAAFIPAFALVLIYLVAMVVLAIVRPSWVPALPPQARIYVESTGRTGHTSLGLLTLASVIVGHQVFTHWPALKLRLGGDPNFTPPTDERVVMALMLGIGFAWLVAVIDKIARTGLLSALARQVTFVLIPPLLLVFLVLGTIFLGVATPTEGGAMGAAGALLMAISRKRLTLALTRQALDSSARLSIFVLFVLIGSTIFALTFQAIEGPAWVKSLFAQLPGGELGFLLFVNALVFVLGFFLDFFEIAFILLPLLLPVLRDMEINLVWFGVMMAMNMQTSFLTPPFGFALFYLRSVAPKEPYDDKVTQARIPAFQTKDIYKGSIAFVCVQLIMVATILFWPEIVLMGLGEQKVLDVENVDLNITPMEEPMEDEPPPSFGPTPTPAPSTQ
jgi:GntP family gluconate:H+ symporter